MTKLSLDHTCTSIHTKSYTRTHRHTNSHKRPYSYMHVQPTTMLQYICTFSLNNIHPCTDSHILLNSHTPIYPGTSAYIWLHTLLYTWIDTHLHKCLCNHIPLWSDTHSHHSFTHLCSHVCFCTHTYSQLEPSPAPSFRPTPAKGILLSTQFQTRNHQLQWYSGLWNGS